MNNIECNQDVTKHAEGQSSAKGATLNDELADVLRTGKQVTLTKGQRDSFYSEFSNGIGAQIDDIRHRHIAGYASAITLVLD